MNMKKTSKKAIILFVLISVLLVFIVTFLVLSNLNSNNGTMRFFDSKGNLLAEYSSKEDRFLYHIEGCEDYVDNAFSEVFDMAKQKQITSYNEQKILNGEIRVYTYFSKECFESLKKSDTFFNYQDGKSTEVAIVSPDGRLLATIAKSKNGNIINSSHKVGSTIKPISVYAPALEANIINWATSVEDSPFKKIESNGKLKSWPANYENFYSNKSVLLKDAVAKSLNTTAVKVLNELTPEKSCEFLESLGISVSYEKQLSNSANSTEVYGCLALGELKEGVTAEKLAAAYQIFANGGSFTECHSVSRISDDEKEIYNENKTAKKVLSSSNSKIMNLLLQGVVSDNGTAKEVKVEGMKIAGKTGTSQGYKDNWFVGFTPEYICSVWYGYDEEQSSRAKNESLLVFKSVISNLKHQKSDFPESEDVIPAEYCIYTQKLANKGCNKTEMGFFDKNNLPQKCNRH